ncbi:Alpha-L-fucosidase 3 [Sarracenia purpurea var. burkii]
MECHSLTSVFSLLVSVLLSVTWVHHQVRGSTTPCDFPAIFNFGDSNSDTGGFSAAFGQAPPPNGESYFRGPAGRYCDGRLVIDFIAESLGLPYLSAYLDAVGSNFSHGANFATAGSTIRPQNTSLQSGFSPFSLNYQFSQFNDFHRRTQIFRNRGGVFKGLLPKAEDFSQALYTFDIGQNDLTAGYFLNMSTHQVLAYIPDVLDQFKTAVKVNWKLYQFYFITILNSLYFCML